MKYDVSFCFTTIKTNKNQVLICVKGGGEADETLFETKPKNKFVS